ncbi:unnamed protein product [Rotaria sordida]|uniref:Uncharacterized protein n=1 Tax=Rotaria sordida TaxID=392033 RepID=A0A816CMG4_9BILA|nr:unnamed protein product [Rotaria sordida]CAF1626984.1 unnamed protein product [Rotaria sordida]
MMNFDNLFRCFILIQSFVRGWRNPFHLQEIFTYRREKIGKQKGNQNYINARFRSPLVNYLPHLVIATAHFQLVLSRDQGFSRRRLFTAVPLINQYPIGSILLENSYYGLRKPPDLLYWCQKMKLTSAILHGFSLGGHMASLIFTKWPDSPSRQFYENKASQTFYDYLPEGNRSIVSNKIVLNLIKDMMRLLIDEFISLYNYSRSVQSNISNGMFIACTQVIHSKYRQRPTSFNRQ